MSNNLLHDVIHEAERFRKSGHRRGGFRDHIRFGPHHGIALRTQIIGYCRKESGFARSRRAEQQQSGFSRRGGLRRRSESIQQDSKFRSSNLHSVNVGGPVEQIGRHGRQLPIVIARLLDQAWCERRNPIVTGAGSRSNLESMFRARLAVLKTARVSANGRRALSLRNGLSKASKNFVIAASARSRDTL